MKESEKSVAVTGMRKHRLSQMASLSALTLASLVSMPAFAQDAAADNAAAEPEIADIIVTGSRVRSSFEQPTPVAIRTASDLQNSQPAGIAFALVQAPQFANSTGPRANTLTSPATAQGNFLNLRGLGASRTLILVDGDRVPPTSFDGLVNVDTIPELLVSRVDVVTAGVSAVYGSDAVSGVVNYILDNKFTGVKLNAQTGVSTYGDAFGYRIGGAFGTAFGGGRGHLVMSAEHRDDEQIRQNDRPETFRQYGLGGRGARSNADAAGTAAVARAMRQKCRMEPNRPRPYRLSGLTC